jgi:hypothetical protein
MYFAKKPNSKILMLAATKAEKIFPFEKSLK